MQLQYARCSAHSFPSLGRINIHGMAGMAGMAWHEHLSGSSVPLITNLPLLRNYFAHTDIYCVVKHNIAYYLTRKYRDCPLTQAL